jgi:hypothetical protein
MSNTDRAIAAEARRINDELFHMQLQRMASYWYACGYNDHRQHETGRKQPYVDPQLFAEYWLTVVVQPSHPSVQDAFRAFRDGVL